MKVLEFKRKKETKTEIEDFTYRMNNIRISLEKINKLMKELDKREEEECEK